jgi:peptide/nickel transport system permease protein
MRLIDIILAVPGILLVVFLASALGSGLENVILIFAVTRLPLFARIARGEVLSLREREFVLAARAVGARPFRVMRLHLLPNAIGVVITTATFQLATVILGEASLGFLGLSVPPTTPSWGNMMAEGRSYMRTAWWLTVFPGLAITWLALGLNLAGDWLRFSLDPRSRGRK